MHMFKYYKRGEGELDTSNFPDLLKQGYVSVRNLNSKTFVSLLALHTYSLGFTLRSPFTVYIRGYVEHMRADKDVFDTAKLYDLMSSFLFRVNTVQHRDTHTIKSSKLRREKVLRDLGLKHDWFTLYVGVDSSVKDFMPDVSWCFEKTRRDGKVTGVDFPIGLGHQPSFAYTPVKRIILVDDILGGGASLKMANQLLRDHGYSGEVYVWMQHNEGIHTKELLNKFNKVYLGNSTT